MTLEPEQIYNTTVLNGWLEGSLRKHIYDEHNLATNSQVNNESAKGAFTTQDQNSNTFIKNNNCWAANYNCFCRSADTGSTLVSPQHILSASHWFGYYAKFIGMDGTVYARTVINNHRVSIGSDIELGLLDAPVPTTGPSRVTIAKILPSNWQSKLPDISLQHRVPTVRWHKYNRVTPVNWWGNQAATVSGVYANTLPYFSKLSEAPNYHEYPYNTYMYKQDYQDVRGNGYQKLYESLKSGDSGQPVYIFIDSEPVVLQHHWFGSGEGGNISYYKTAINNQMATLGGTSAAKDANGNPYKLIEIDLSSWPSY